MVIGVTLLVLESFVPSSLLVSTATALCLADDGSSKGSAPGVDELIPDSRSRSKLVSSKEKKRTTKLNPHSIAHQYLTIVLARDDGKVYEKTYQDPLPALAIIYEPSKHGCKKAATRKHKSVQCNVRTSLMCEILYRCESSVSTPNM